MSKPATPEDRERAMREFLAASPYPGPSRPRPAGRLGAALSGRTPEPGPRAFVPLDPATLEHLPKSAAVNVPPANAIPGQPPMWPSTDADRIAALLGACPEGTARLLGDLAALDDATDTAADAHETVEIPVTVGDVTVIHRGRIPRQRGRYLAAILATMTGAAILGVGVVAPAPAQAATRVTASSTATDGPGLTLRGGAHHKGSLHAGSYTLGGRQMYCISYGAQMGDGPTHTGTQAAEVTYLLDTWGNTASNAQAADVYLAVDSLAASSAFRADLSGYLSQLADGGARVKAMLAQAARLAGPWHLAVSVPKTSPGTMAVATVTVTSASGSPVPGAVVTVHGIGATVSAATTADGAGEARTEVRPSALSYTVTASVSGPGTTVWTNSPSAGHQVLVGAGPNVTVTGSACASVCPVSATVTESAACTDQGAHQLTVTFSADSTPGSYRGTLTVNGVAATSALAPESTVTLQVQVHAGDVVSVSWQALDDGGTVLINRTLTSLTVQS